MCQSLATPLVELYWHIGDIPMRFLKVTPLIFSDEKSAAVISRSLLVSFASNTVGIR